VGYSQIVPPSNFIVEMTKSLVWPLAVVIVALIFKKPILWLIDRIKAMEYGKGRLEFEGRPEEEIREKIGAREVEPQAAPPFERLSPEARKVLKTLWKFQIDMFSDFKNRFGFKVDPMIAGQANEEFKEYNKGRSELTAFGLVFVDPRLMCFLTGVGIRYCTANAAEIDREPNFYGEFRPG